MGVPARVDDWAACMVGGAGGQLRLLPEVNDLRVPDYGDTAPGDAAVPADSPALQATVVSLSEYLGALGDGSPCFACGTRPLEPAGISASAAGLVCAGCGAEIEVLEDAGPNLPETAARAAG